MTIDGNDGLRIHVRCIYICTASIRLIKIQVLGLYGCVGWLSMGRDAQCKSKEELFE